MPPKVSRDEKTKRELLAAAGEIFSRKGYRRATVREICQRAGANVAAITYHFGGKAGLYEAVLADSHAEAMRRHPPDQGLPPQAPVEERLYAFIHSFLLRLLGKGKPAWHGRIINWEMFEPTEVLEGHLRRSILPIARYLQGLVAEVLGAGPDDPRVILCSQSVVGQCRHYILARPILERMFPGCRLDQAGIARLAAHITEFSLAGIRQAPVPAPGQSPVPSPVRAGDPACPSLAGPPPDLP